MQTVTLEPADWNQLLAVLANAQGPGLTWAVINPLIMKLGEQLRTQGGNGLDPDASAPRFGGEAERNLS